MLHNVNIDAWLSLVERCVRDAEVAGSNPVASTPWQGHRKHLSFKFPVFFNQTASQSNIDAWLSLVERCVRDAEVASSNLVASTSKKENRSREWFSFLLFGTKSMYLRSLPALTPFGPTVAKTANSRIFLSVLVKWISPQVHYQPLFPIQTFS